MSNNNTPESLEILGQTPATASITVKMSAKGDRYWDMKRYQKEGETIEEVINELVKTDLLLKKAFIDVEGK